MTQQHLFLPKPRQHPTNHQMEMETILRARSYEENKKGKEHCTCNQWTVLSYAPKTAEKKRNRLLVEERKSDRVKSKLSTPGMRRRQLYENATVQ